MRGGGENATKQLNVTLPLWGRAWRETESRIWQGRTTMKGYQKRDLLDDHSRVTPKRISMFFQLLSRRLLVEVLPMSLKSASGTSPSF